MSAYTPSAALETARCMSAGTKGRGGGDRLCGWRMHAGIHETGSRAQHAKVEPTHGRHSEITSAGQASATSICSCAQVQVWDGWAMERRTGLGGDCHGHSCSGSHIDWVIGGGQVLCCP